MNEIEYNLCEMMVEAAEHPQAEAIGMELDRIANEGESYRMLKIAENRDVFDPYYETGLEEDFSGGIHEMQIAGQFVLVGLDN